MEAWHGHWSRGARGDVGVVLEGRIGSRQTATVKLEAGVAGSFDVEEQLKIESGEPVGGACRFGVKGAHGRALLLRRRHGSSISPTPCPVVEGGQLCSVAAASQKAPELFMHVKTDNIRKWRPRRVKPRRRPAHRFVERRINNQQRLRAIPCRCGHPDGHDRHHSAVEERVGDLRGTSTECPTRGCALS